MERAELARRLAAGDERARAGATDATAVIVERDPAAFMAAFASAAASAAPVFLGDPEWTESHQAALHTSAALRPESWETAAQREQGWLMIPSGGTSGRLKFARHDAGTLAAAVRGFAAHFELPRVNAVSVLPLYHVSGFMAWMRCVLTGGEFVPWNWKRLEAGDAPATPGDNWVVSLVPTQLQRLLGNPAAVEWLRRFRIIFVGGGPVWPELADRAAAARLPVALSYGMTETAAMVTALRPAEFLAGDRSSGTTLPHARMTVTDEGVLAVEGESVFRGYWPGKVESRRFVTEDLGEIDARGRLRVLGRRDAMIITGGKKVQPLEVEAALRASGEFDDVAVIGVADPEWGERVVACFPQGNRGGRVPDLARAVAALPLYQRPKQFVPFAEWPRNAQGKLNRAALRAAVSTIR